MSRLAELVNEYVQQYLTSKPNLTASTKESAPATKAWLASLGLVPTAAFSEARIHYLYYRIARNLIQASGGNPEDLKFAVEDATPYLVLIDSFHASNKAENEPLIRKAIAVEAAELFYASSRPERFDLFNHMSAGELFFVDVDSLLLEALCNYHVDWEIPQVVHVAHLVRKILHGYKARGGHFHVVEFDCNRFYWQNSPSKLMLRDVITAHLNTLSKANTPQEFHYKRFPNWWEEGKNSWKQYVRRYGPEFVVVNDGEQLLPADAAASKTFSLVLDDKDAEERGKQILLDSAETGRDAVTMLRSFVMSLIADRIHVVFSSRQVYKDNAIVAFVIRAHSSKFRPLTALMPCAELWWQDRVNSIAKPADYTDEIGRAHV